jgi:branched-chain amino acid transport system permease protein
VRLAIVNESWLANGVRGIAGVPAMFQGAGAYAPLAIVAALILVNVAVVFVLHVIVKSPFGRALEAVRDDETALTALGSRRAGSRSRC